VLERREGCIQGKSSPLIRQFFGKPAAERILPTRQANPGMGGHCISLKLRRDLREKATKKRRADGYVGKARSD